jgi:hypothetical protein
MRGMDLRLLLGAAFVTAMGVVSCGGGGGNSGASSNPSSLIPTPTPKPTPTPTPLPSGVTPAPLSVEIFYSGSVEFSPFTIVLAVNGSAQVTVPSAYTPLPGTVPASTTGQLFKDLNTYGPVNKLPIGTCPKPTGTTYDDTTILLYQSQTSGDVSCPGAASTTAVYNDVKNVEIAVGLTPPT